MAPTYAGRVPLMPQWPRVKPSIGYSLTDLKKKDRPKAATESNGELLCHGLTSIAQFINKIKT